METMAIGGEGRARPSWERVRETRGGVREDERGRGGRVAPLGVSGRRRKQEVASAWPARGEHAPLPPGARRMTTGEASRLGRARWAGQLR